MLDEVKRRKIPEPQILEFARCLLAYEASTAQADALMGVSEKLRLPLGTLLGTVGYRALLTRALALAKEHEPGLTGVYLEQNGGLAGFKVNGTQHQSDTASVMLIAQLLGLLDLFIGNSLTMKFLLDVWPALPVSETKLLEKLDDGLTR